MVSHFGGLSPSNRGRAGSVRSKVWMEGSHLRSGREAARDVSPVPSRRQVSAADTWERAFWELSPPVGQDLELSRTTGMAGHGWASDPVPDDNRMTELPDRISELLSAARAAGEEFLAQARAQADLIERRANAHARALSDRVESDATELMGRARRKAREHFEESQRSSEAMVARARQEMDSAAAELTTRRAELRSVEDEIEVAQVKLVELRNATAAIAGMTDDVLRRFGTAPTANAPTSSRRELPSSVQRKPAVVVLQRHLGLVIDADRGRGDADWVRTVRRVP